MLRVCPLRYLCMAKGKATRGISKNLICKAGPHDPPDSSRSKDEGRLDAGYLSYKKYALNELIKDDKQALTVSEIKDILKDMFYRLMLEIVIMEDRKVFIKIREWRDGDSEEELLRVIACINQWRSGEILRQEILKRLNFNVEFFLPLDVTHVDVDGMEI